jgi:hypothetical protein
MNSTHLRLTELAAATLVSLTVLAAAVAPALLAAAPQADRTPPVEQHAGAGIECKALPAPYRA